MWHHAKRSNLNNKAKKEAIPNVCKETDSRVSPRHGGFARSIGASARRKGGGEFCRGIPKDITRSIMIDDGRKIYQRYERGALRYIFIVEAVKGRGRITFWEVGSKVAYVSDLRQRKDANPLDAFDSSELGQETLRQLAQRKRAGEAIVNGIRCTRWLIGDGSDYTAELYEDAHGEMVYLGAFLRGKLLHQSILVQKRDAQPGDWKQVAIPSGVKVNVVDESELQKRIAEIYLRAAGHDMKLFE